MSILINASMVFKPDSRAGVARSHAHMTVRSTKRGVHFSQDSVLSQGDVDLLCRQAAHEIRFKHVGIVVLSRASQI